ncbi:hypothetical protein SS50377_25754 [Spironucleus salmonicida]|uniref:Uncharacterized protein n=1 Tax=Spironucleus salmonicida TaxID=348837 RepID=V6M4K7_9EUKA|nr:hypothetical protein SS50377_25754 [Spironucleus salmonicida]|eukprot:EST48269.1 Hypothetical protein SS50377_11610 [Spironucleus salmonicida]
MLILLQVACEIVDGILDDQECELSQIDAKTNFLMIQNSLVSVTSLSPISVQLLQIYNSTFLYKTQITQAITIFVATIAADINFVRVDFHLNQQQAVQTTFIKSPILVSTNIRIIIRTDNQIDLVFSNADKGSISNVYLQSNKGNAVIDQLKFVYKTADSISENVEVPPLNFIIIHPINYSTSLEKYYKSEDVVLLCNVSRLSQEQNFCNFDVLQYQELTNLQQKYIIYLESKSGRFIFIALDLSILDEIIKCEGIYIPQSKLCQCGKAATLFKGDQCVCPPNFNNDCKRCEGEFLLSISQEQCQLKCQSCQSQCYYDGSAGEKIVCLCGLNQKQIGTTCVASNLQAIRTGSLIAFGIIFIILIITVILLSQKKEKDHRMWKENQ